MPRTAKKSPILRKCDKITITAAAVIALAVAASSAIAGSPTAGDLPTLSQSYVSDAAKRGFNPQPEPPKIRNFGNRAGSVMLNPQPEPPSAGWIVSR